MKWIKRNKAVVLLIVGFLILLAAALWQNKQLKAEGEILYVVVGAVLYIFSSLGFLFPSEVHFLLKGWKYEKPELSGDGEIMEKFGALIGLVLSALVMLQMIQIQ